MAISQYILNPKEQYLSEVLIRSKWMIRIRWYYLVLLTFVASLTTVITNGENTMVRQFIAIGSLGLIANGLLRLSLQKKSNDPRYYQIISVIQVLLDTVLASYVVYLQGGIASRATALYALPILISGILFFGWFAFWAALLSSLSYTASLVTYHYAHPNSYALHQIAVPAFFYSCVFFIIAAVIMRFSAINALNERESSYSQLLAMLRHQLRRPSSTIATLADGLKTQGDYSRLSEAQIKLIDQIKKENLALNKMVESLLAAADPRPVIKKSELDEVDLAKLLKETAHSCALAAKRSNDLILNVPSHLVVARAAPQQLSMALNNIIDNAFRYSQPSTPVTITVKRLGKKQLIIIEDEGKGIDSKNQRELFHRFSSFDENTVAESPADNLYTSGLGLYISKLIIERHGGSLKLQSSKGRGTKITIRI